jgi:hypothetical protein
MSDVGAALGLCFIVALVSWARTAELGNTLAVARELLREVHLPHPQPDVCEACKFLGRV